MYSFFAIKFLVEIDFGKSIPDIIDDEPATDDADYYSNYCALTV